MDVEGQVNRVVLRWHPAIAPKYLHGFLKDTLAF